MVILQVIIKNKIKETIMGLKLVQSYDKDPDFSGIVYDERDEVGYDGCDWDGKMNEPYPNLPKEVRSKWLHLYNNAETFDAFVGEKKLEDGKWWGLVWWM